MRADLHQALIKNPDGDACYLSHYQRFPENVIKIHW